MIVRRSSAPKCQAIVERGGLESPCKQSKKSKGALSLCGSHERSAKLGRKIKLQNGRVLNPKGMSIREIDRMNSAKSAARIRSEERVAKAQKLQAPAARPVVPPYLLELITVYEKECGGDMERARKKLGYSKDYFINLLRIAREEHGL